LAIKIESDGGDVFVVFNGTRIARRGHLGTLKAGTWVSLEPGFRVRDGDGGPASGELIVEHDGVVVH